MFLCAVKGILLLNYFKIRIKHALMQRQKQGPQPSENSLKLNHLNFGLNWSSMKLKVSVILGYLIVNCSVHSLKKYCSTFTAVHKAFPCCFLASRLLSKD